MRGAIGPPGPAGAKGEPGNPGQQGPPGTERILRVCNCQWNVPTQVFYVNSGHWISAKTMVGFQDVTSANGEFHVKVVAPVTYVLHVGGKFGSLAVIFLGLTSSPGPTPLLNWRGVRRNPWKRLPSWSMLSRCTRCSGAFKVYFQRSVVVFVLGKYESVVEMKRKHFIAHISSCYSRTFGVFWQPSPPAIFNARRPRDEIV